MQCSYYQVQTSKIKATTRSIKVTEPVEALPSALIQFQSATYKKLYE